MKAHKLFGKDKKHDDQAGLDTLSEEVNTLFACASFHYFCCTLFYFTLHKLLFYSLELS